MSSNIAQLIQDIDRRDLHRRNMMKELKVLRDITLFYNERHPELRAAEPPTTAENTQDGSTQQHDTGTTAAPDSPETQANLEDNASSKNT